MNKLQFVLEILKMKLQFILETKKLGRYLNPCSNYNQKIQQSSSSFINKNFLNYLEVENTSKTLRSSNFTLVIPAYYCYSIHYLHILGKYRLLLICDVCGTRNKIPNIVDVNRSFEIIFRIQAVCFDSLKASQLPIH